MKYCPNCGKANSEGNKYCINCGEPLETTYSNRPILDTGNIKSRSIPVCIILSIVTCGLYLIYWQIKLNNEINYLVGDTKAPSGVIVLILEIVTCNLYGIYWAYKMGEKTDAIFGKNRSYSIIFLIIQLFALPIVSLALMQDTINNSL